MYLLVTPRKTRLDQALFGTRQNAHAVPTQVTQGMICIDRATAVSQRFYIISSSSDPTP